MVVLCCEAEILDYYVMLSPNPTAGDGGSETGGVEGTVKRRSAGLAVFFCCL